MGALLSCVRPKVAKDENNYNGSSGKVSRENSSDSISIGEEYRRLHSKKQKIEKHKQVWQ